MYPYRLFSRLDREREFPAAPMSSDFAECDRARLARDAAYDGLFFTGVRTTRIYCRPVCPARLLVG